jgi:uncharacterized membrane protein
VTTIEPPATPPLAGPRRLPAWIALFVIATIYLIVNERLSIGPTWLPLALVLLFLVPITVTRVRGHLDWTRRIALVLTALITAVVASSAAFLVLRLPRGGLPAQTLLLDAALIWIANILVFALWYWEVDAGGPAVRHAHGYQTVDFAFPQAILDDRGGWCPGFVDYLFLAFNTATAFSPTDTMVLSRRAKALMMGQSVISLVVIAFLAARAINTL